MCILIFIMIYSRLVELPFREAEVRLAMHSLASSLAGLMKMPPLPPGVSVQAQGCRPGGRWQSRCRAACGKWGGSRGVAVSATGGDAGVGCPVGVFGSGDRGAGLAFAVLVLAMPSAQSEMKKEPWARARSQE